MDLSTMDGNTHTLPAANEKAMQETVECISKIQGTPFLMLESSSEVRFCSMTSAAPPSLSESMVIFECSKSRKEEPTNRKVNGEGSR